MIREYERGHVVGGRDAELDDSSFDGGSRPRARADWHGWTLTDVVFASVLWIVGVSLTLSFQKRLAASATPADLFTQAVRRAAILFALGLLTGFPPV